MPNTDEKHTLAMLITGEDGRTRWGEYAWASEMRGGMDLSPRVGCSSLRLRTSEPGYRAGWHIAGEPVLIIVRQGVLRIGLRDGMPRDFSAGDAFIAGDVVPDGESFDPTLHGHTAEVVGDVPFEAVHIKLDRLGG